MTSHSVAVSIPGTQGWCINSTVVYVIPFLTERRQILRETTGCRSEAVSLELAQLQASCHSLQHCPHFLCQLQVPGAPETILSFSNLLDHTQFTESYYTYGYSLLQGKDTD